jgi:hypothetical protein
MRLILKLIRSAFLFGMLFLLSLFLTSRLDAPALPALAVAKTPDDLIWWKEQAVAAGLAGFSAAETEYKAREEAFIKILAAPLLIPIEHRLLWVCSKAVESLALPLNRHGKSKSISCR